MASYDRFYCIQLSLMGNQFEKFEKLKKLINPSTHTGKTGSGKGKQQYFKVGPRERCAQDSLSDRDQSC